MNDYQRLEPGDLRRHLGNRAPLGEARQGPQRRVQKETRGFETSVVYGVDWRAELSGVERAIGVLAECSTVLINA